MYCRALKTSNFLTFWPDGVDKDVLQEFHSLGGPAFLGLRVELIGTQHSVTLQTMADWCVSLFDPEMDAARRLKHRTQWEWAPCARASRAQAGVAAPVTLLPRFENEYL